MAEARLQRQRAVLRSGGPTYEIILDEIFIRRLGVHPDVLADQLRHLVETARTAPNITVLVLPVDARLPGALLPKSLLSLHVPRRGGPADGRRGHCHHRSRLRRPGRGRAKYTTV
jgi:hypothetical protein